MDNLVSLGFDEVAPSRDRRSRTHCHRHDLKWVSDLGTSKISTIIPVLRRPYMRSGTFQKLYRLKTKAYLSQRRQSAFKNIARCISRLYLSGLGSESSGPLLSAFFIRLFTSFFQNILWEIQRIKHLIRYSCFRKQAVFRWISN